jgi:hypothetical protein
MDRFLSNSIRDLEEPDDSRQTTPVELLGCSRARFPRRGCALRSACKREVYQFVLSEWNSKARSRKMLMKKTVATVLWTIASQIASLVA